MATNYDDIMNKHFDAAGIEPDNTEDKSNNDGNDQSQEDNAQDTGTESGEGAQDQEGDQSSRDEGDRSGGGKDGKPEQQSKPEAKGKEGQARDPNKPNGKQRVNAEADRWREQYNVKGQQVKDLNNQVKMMTQSRDQWKDKHDALQRTVQSVNGADPNTVAMGVRIVRDIQNDPVGTLRKLLTEAVANGHTVEGIGAGVDTAAITRLIESRMPQNSTDNRQNNDAAIDTEISQFYGQYPDARVHDELLARVLTDHPQLSLTEAMFELKGQFAARGLNWNKSIDDAANMAILHPSGGQDNNNRQQNGQKPMPNGRQGVTARPADKTAVAHESASTSDIVKEAMREAGMNIS